MNGSSPHTSNMKEILHELLEDVEESLTVQFNKLKTNFLGGLSKSVLAHIGLGLKDKHDFDLIKLALEEQIASTFEKDISTAFNHLIEMVDHFHWNSVGMITPKHEDVPSPFMMDDKQLSSRRISVTTPPSRPLSPEPIKNKSGRVSRRTSVFQDEEDDFDFDESLNNSPSIINQYSYIAITAVRHDHGLLFERMKVFIKQLVPKGSSKGSVLLVGDKGTHAWLVARTNRITASKFGAYCKVRDFEQPQEMAKLVHSILSINKSFDQTMLDYSREVEKIARRAYSQVTGNHVEETGFWIQQEFPWLGATPDGLVFDMKNEEKGLLEIKCPFSAKGMTIEEFSNSQGSYLVHNGIRLTLDKSHNYHYQIQGCMFALDADWCDFVLWTGVDMHLERIQRDQGFIDDVVLRLSEFYVRFLLPSLASGSHKGHPPIYSVLTKQAYECEFKAVCCQENN